MFFDGYVLSNELAQKAGVANANFYANENIVRDKMGHATVLKIDTLPKKYKEIALNECTNLSNKLTLTQASLAIGACSGYFAHIRFSREKMLTIIKTPYHVLVEFPPSFTTLVDDGYTPFLIKKDNEDYAQQSIKAFGAKIGFYK